MLCQHCILARADCSFQQEFKSLVPAGCYFVQKQDIGNRTLERATWEAQGSTGGSLGELPVSPSQCVMDEPGVSRHPREDNKRGKESKQGSHMPDDP